MSEKIQDKDVFSLLEVTRSIQKTLSERYQSVYWIRAEIVKLNLYPHSGHCYPDLAEKKNGQVIAQMRSNLWRDDYIRVNNNFQKILKEPLKEGIQILFCAKITFEPTYGLSLRIIDIDPSFSLGELEREKQETIERLKKEGIFNKNRELQLPILPQRIAIISVDTSKGYADFMKVINNNSWGYKFFYLLFPSLLQGEKAVESIIGQLKRIKKVIEHFDAVTIIRGGGGDVGLSCYNNYELVREIALYPIPVITGIGHSTNETVTEMIAYKNAITPTELADFLIQKFHNFSVPVHEAEKIIKERSAKIIEEKKQEFYNTIKYFRSVTSNMLIRNQNSITNNIKTLGQQSKYLLKRENESYSLLIMGMRKETIMFCTNLTRNLKQIAGNIRKDSVNYIKNEFILMANLEKSIMNMSPANVLKRGYSITLKNGKAIRSYEQVKEGDIIKSIIFEGTIDSEVKTINKSENI